MELVENVFFYGNCVTDLAVLSAVELSNFRNSVAFFRPQVVLWEIYIQSVSNG